ASATIVSLTDGVMKTMFLSKMKMALVVAMTVLALGTGVGVMTGASGTPVEEPAPKEDPAAGLVRQLGDPDFKVREGAMKKIRALGAKAIPALKAGSRDPSPEVEWRSKKVLDAIRADVREAFAKEFDPKQTEEYDHPVWKRFKTIAGSDAPARKLFAEIIADPRSFRLLDDAESDPERAGDLYAAEIVRAYDAVLQKVLDRARTYTAGSIVVPQPTLPAILYLGTYPSSTGKVKDGWAHEGQIVAADSRGRWGTSPSAPALQRVFAAWLLHRDHPTTLERGLGIAVADGIENLLPVARKLAADAKHPATTRLAALAAVAQFGARA